MSIHSEVMALRQVIDDSMEKIASLQQKCSHPIEARTSHQARTNDEWDSHAHYSNFHKCDLCGFSWVEDAGGD